MSALSRRFVTTVSAASRSVEGQMTGSVTRSCRRKMRLMRKELVWWLKSRSRRRSGHSGDLGSKATCGIRIIQGLEGERVVNGRGWPLRLT